MSIFANMREQQIFPAWSPNQRLKFIDAKLYWEGRINRADLVEAYSISVQQASADFSAYNDAAPNNLLYDPRLKGYISSDSFRPLFEVSTPGAYLAELATGGGFDEPTGKWTTPVQTLPRLERKLDSSVVRAVLSAIRSASCIEISYHSMSKPEVSKRWIEPHSIATDGDRWHVRAYCHMRTAFLDFVLARIGAVGERKKAAFTREDDLDWESHTTVVFEPHPNMEPSQRAFLEHDYGMQDGTLVFQVRNAMLFYLLIRYGRQESSEPDNPSRFQIVLGSESELRSTAKQCVGGVRKRG